MAIFTDAQLEALFEENGISKRASSEIDSTKDLISHITDNVDDVKEIKYSDKSTGVRVKSSRSEYKINIKDPKEKKNKFRLKVKLNEDGEYVAIDDESDDYAAIEEITKDGKKYRRLKSDEEAHVSPKDIIIIGGKKYIYDIKDSINNPVRTAGEKIGDYTGGAIGRAVGGAVGSAAGPVGATVGTYVGSKIGSGWGEKSGEVVGTAAAHTKIGKSITNGVRKGISSATKSPKKKVTRESVFRYPEFTKAMNEYFDIDHKETRDILLAVNEDDQSKVLVSLTSKLYENIIDKVDDIDFGEIPMTKGDITKLSNYRNLCDCCDTMSKILIEYKQDTKPIDTVITAIRNIEDSTDIWKRAFSGNIELPMVVYNTTVLAIIEATSYLISMCVEFIKVPSSDTFQIMIDKSALSKTKGHMVFENLEKFNDAYRKGQIKNAMNYVIKENVKNFAGTTIGAGAALVGITSLLFIIIPIIRELIFLFYYSRVRVADYFEVQADMLQINAYNVENNRMDLTKEQKKNITTKQIKIADKFRKFSNNIAVSAKESEIKASKEISNQNKKYKVSDVMDEMPDSASSALF